jgi:hypothetical protein
MWKESDRMTKVQLVALPPPVGLKRWRSSKRHGVQSPRVVPRDPKVLARVTANMRFRGRV